MKTVLVHGGPGLKNYWPEVLGENELSDFHHFEFSPHTEMNGYVEQLSSQDLGDAVVVGHSFGGTVVVEALRQGLLTQVRGVVLVSAPTSHLMQAEFEVEMKKLGADPMDPFQGFLSESERSEESVKNKLIQILSSMNSEVLERVGAEFLSNFEHREFLETLNIPCMILTGSEDHRVPVSVQKQVAESNPEFSFQEIAGAGHFPFFQEDHRKEFLEVIKAFQRP